MQENQRLPILVDLGTARYLKLPLLPMLPILPALPTLPALPKLPAQIRN